MTLDWLNEKQIEAVDKLEGKSGIVWWKIGEGKTRIALALYLRYLIRCQNAELLVICSPNAQRQWLDEIAGIPLVEIKPLFLSYGLLSDMSPTAQWRAFKLPLLGKDIFIVLDELWMYKNVRAQRTQAAHELCRERMAIGLSGSMITNRNIEDLYGQSYAIGISPMVARTLTHFRTQFLIAYEDFGLKFTPKKGALKTIQERLAPNVDIYFPKDIRETRIQRVNIDPTEEQQEHFDTVSNEYYAKFKDGTELEIKNAAVLISKLQQISDGTVLDNEGNTILLPSSKLRRLEELVQELFDAGERIIIWFAFKASLKRAYKIFGTKATTLSSDTRFDSVGWRNKKYSCTLATIGSGASLNDFASCQYSIIYSAPFSYRALQQSMGRTNRTGSEHAVCHYYFLQTTGSVDERVYDHNLLTGQLEKGYINSSIEIVKEYMATMARMKTRWKNPV